ncbi:hypothetical protein OG906_32055 [Streptomyces sp. NBC_01426]|uniref:hypothetical protein n=1 Tax=Streptomyces sp. NBC_01426 TaxID=2975866 RepID=UPI002E369374|nr:hypothetical protein [Streptomyces sp. NBC_01426]
MNMPDDGDERSTAHLRELELFLSVHLGRAPGVLWPEYDNPAFGRGDVGEAGEAGDVGDVGDGDDTSDACDAGDGGDRDGEGGTVPADDGPRAARLEAFTGRLGALTGLAVRAELIDTGAHARVDPQTTAAVSSTDHLLIHQIDGAVTWRLTGPGEDGGPASFQCRLLPGEVLYVPARWDRRAECARGIRYAVVSLRRAGE